MFKAMLKKEILLLLRDRHALAALFVMPAIFILIMSLALKDVFNEERSLASFTLINNSTSDVARELSALLSSSKMLEESRDGTQFRVTIPENFTHNFDSDSRLEPLDIVVSPDVKQDLLALFKVEIAMSIVEIRLQKLKEELKEFSSSADGLDIDIESMMNLSFDKMAEGETPTSTQQSVPSWIVFALFFVIIPMSTVFIGERQQNTLMRLESMNVSTTVLFVGKIIPYFIINQLQVWVMIAVGLFVVPLFGAAALTLGDSLLALFLISGALSFAAISLSMLIAVLVNTVEQATTIGGIINILLGAIGGVMVPKFVMPEFMQTFSNISPMSWGLEGFLDIFLRKEGVEAVVGESLALMLFGAVMLAFAMIVYRVKR